MDFMPYRKNVSKCSKSKSVGASSGISTTTITWKSTPLRRTSSTTKTQAKPYNLPNMHSTSYKKYTPSVKVLKPKTRAPCSTYSAVRLTFLFKSLSRKISPWRGSFWHGLCMRCWTTSSATGVCCMLDMRRDSRRCLGKLDPKKPTTICSN